MACNRYFTGGNNIVPKVIWEEYTKGKQTYEQLATQYKCSKRTIQRIIDQYDVVIPKKKARKVVVLIDTTYFGKSFGIMLFKDAYTKENLLKYYVKTETNTLYKQGIIELQKQGFKVLAIVCDGHKGLLQSFDKIPVQNVSISSSSNY